MVVDDYAHHPSEIKATIEAAKNTGRNRIITLFQPHRYSRTQALKVEFGQAFREAAAVFVTDVYAASEQPVPGVSGQTIVDELIRDGHPSAVYQPDRKQMLLDVGRMLQPGDCVISLGAGNIHEQATALSKDVAQMEQLKSVIGTGEIKLY